MVAAVNYGSARIVHRFGRCALPLALGFDDLADKAKIASARRVKADWLLCPNDNVIPAAKQHWSMVIAWGFHAILDILDDACQSVLAISCPMRRKACCSAQS